MGFKGGLGQVGQKQKVASGLKVGEGASAGRDSWNWGHFRVET